VYVTVRVSPGAKVMYAGEEPTRPWATAETFGFLRLTFIVAVAAVEVVTKAAIRGFLRDAWIMTFGALAAAMETRGFLRVGLMVAAVEFFTTAETMGFLSAALMMTEVGVPPELGVAAIGREPMGEEPMGILYFHSK
jgi:hypothetical protein